MTQNSLSIKEQNPKQNQKQSKKQNKKSSLLRHTLGSYWWLAFACGVVYFFAGPVFTLLYLNGMNFDDSSIHYLPGELHRAGTQLDCHIMPEDASFQISANGITYYDSNSREVVFLD
ncbi:MAG: hypothetical protein IJ936_06330, partial [Peptococcaceae bacterium]|nr:hypothetical protein [Peptococcaceae bacterium]